MTRGLVYVVFGKEYDKLAAHTVAYSRQFTDLPICVFSNLKKHDEKWNEFNNIEIKYLSLSVYDNRMIKTKLIQYSPFDITLYMDCDSLLQRTGIEGVFDLLGNEDLLLCQNLTWDKGTKVLLIYKKMMKQVGITLPITIYSGGFQLFQKNENTFEFYKLWNKYWELSGKGRDMPALNCAIQNSKVQIKEVRPKDNIFAAEIESDETIIQHRFNGFVKKFNLPKWNSWKPFDKGGSGFTFVDFES